MKQIVFILTIFVLHATDAWFRKYKTVRVPVPVDAEEPLILTPLIEAGKINEARQLAKVTFEKFATVPMYTGYLNVDKQFENNLFFYFFPSESNYDIDPVILWLQGGPGAPAGYGIFMENGPYNVTYASNRYDVFLREHRWTRNHSVLYIDNPVGTGFSFTTKQGYAQNQTKVGADLYEGLLQFFTLFPELQKNPFFVTGESYGGKYVPAIGYTIHKSNPNASLKINLQGLATGNGLSDPVNQAKYGEYLYQLGFIDANALETFREYEAQVVKFVAEENWYEATRYFDDKMNGLIGEATEVISEYNYVQMERDDPEYWESYLQSSLREELHIGNTEFNSGPVFENLYEDISKSVAPWIEELLESYRFLIYSGQLDIIVAYPLTENFLQKLNFTGAEDYIGNEKQVWLDSEGGVAGYYKEAGNLMSVLVRNAGHMVPVNQPKRAYSMIYNWVRGQPLD